jgi:hypothetical protein
MISMIAPVFLVVALAQNNPNPASAQKGRANQQQPARPAPATIQNQPQPVQTQSSAAQSTTSNNPEISQKAVVWSAIVQAAAAVISLGLTVWLILHSRKGWQIAEDANQISRQAFNLEQRPWLGLDVGLIGIRKLPRGDDKTEWAVTCSITLTHHGKSPATFVSVQAKLVPSMLGYHSGGIGPDGIPQGELVKGTDPIDEVDRICAPMPPGLPRQFTFGYVMFPNEVRVHHWNMPFPIEGETEHFSGAFLVVVGVSYKSASLEDAFYKTAKAYLLVKKTGDGKIPFRGEPLKAEDVEFVQYPFGSGSTAT